MFQSSIEVSLPPSVDDDITAYQMPSIFDDDDTTNHSIQLENISISIDPSIDPTIASVYARSNLSPEAIARRSARSQSILEKNEMKQKQKKRKAIHLAFLFVFLIVAGLTISLALGFTSDGVIQDDDSGNIDIEYSEYTPKWMDEEVDIDVEEIECDEETGELVVIEVEKEVDDEEKPLELPDGITAEHIKELMNTPGMSLELIGMYHNQGTLPPPLTPQMIKKKLPKGVTLEALRLVSPEMVIQVMSSTEDDNVSPANEKPDKKGNYNDGDGKEKKATDDDFKKVDKEEGVLTTVTGDEKDKNEKKANMKEEKKNASAEEDVRGRVRHLRFRSGDLDRKMSSNSSSNGKKKVRRLVKCIPKASNSTSQSEISPSEYAASLLAVLEQHQQQEQQQAQEEEEEQYMVGALTASPTAPPTIDELSMEPELVAASISMQPVEEPVQCGPDIECFADTKCVYIPTGSEKYRCI